MPTPAGRWPTQFTTESGKGLLVAWTAEGWRCVNGVTDAPLRPRSDEEAQDMRDAEAQASEMQDAAAAQPRPRLAA